MTVTWLVVADVRKAKVYKFVPLKAQLSFITAIEHPENSLKEHDLVTDRPGHYQRHGSPSRGAYGDDYSTKEVNFEKFAKELAQWLDKARMAKRYAALVVAAPPHYLGLLRKNLSKPLKAVLRFTIPKDLIPVPEDELAAIIGKEYAKAPHNHTSL
jgi:protein required for attachment to host cells